eukprot:CAMPEP_0183299414 /NCGR_PEP_ID=MMETSP0160_2-20130417/6151_1 /TAXON_ID=2839 ORGANISM="Odontella Sinensis, Strain Grunow 1884" /NCGR_SAMPLE_ID=MMETSP0160_2 /ASSEMBLY_ACC=CAM_ASM_000250 /LENGTH=399 /DNA_ID=CAMNT_0025461647 /DNA_START=69 /DNA_END=1265 /DNA_ORIENTATION=+
MKVLRAALVSFTVLTLVRQTIAKWECIGDRLDAGDKLNVGEFVCSDSSGTNRIGLDKDGIFLQYKDDKVNWTTEKKGEYLILQKTGQLVVRDGKDNTVWASKCYAENSFLGFDETYPNLGARTMVSAPVNDNGETYLTVWSTEPHPKLLIMDRTSCNPPIYCKGKGMLLPGKALRRDEYLCPHDDWGGSNYMFGVDNKGQAVLRKDQYAPYLWSSSTGGGVELRMQQRGKLVLRDRHGGVLWESGCKKEGNTLKMTSAAIMMTDENDETSLYIDYDGHMSECFPDPDDVPTDKCTHVSNSADHTVCKIKMIDSLNNHETVLRVKDMSNRRYKVTDNFDGDEPWEIFLDLLDTGAFISDYFDPEVTCHELIEEHEMKNDGQLTFETQGKQCTEFGKNLIW